MLIDNLTRLILVSASYLILVFGISFIMIKGIDNSRTFLDKILRHFILGNFYLINMVYLLLFLRITSRIITIILLLVGAIIIRYFLDKESFMDDIGKGIRMFALLSDGSYGWNLYIKDGRKKIISKIVNNLKRNSLEFVLLFTNLAIHGYYIGYRFVFYSGLGMYDEFVHLAWVQNMLNGNIFSDGVYPFGMHNILYILTNVFGFKGYTVIRNFGFIIVICMFFMLYFLLKKLCKSKYTPYISLFLYVALNLYQGSAWDRLQYTLPEEFGLVFLYPVAIYFYNFLRNHNKDDLVLFSISFTMTIYIHYYITIIAFVLCLCIGFSRIYKIFKEKLFTKILLCGFLSFLIGILPIGVGLALGYELQGSLDWAIGVITQSVDEEEQDIIDSTDENEIIIPTEENLGIKDKTVFIFKQLKEKAISSVVHTQIFWILLMCIGIVILNTILRNIFNRRKKETFLQFSIALYVLILFILLDSTLFGLPTIIEDYRISVFLGYAIPLLLCMPFELTYFVFKGAKWSKILFNVIVIGFIGIVAWVVYSFDDYKKEFSQFRLLQSDSSVNVLYNIFENYSDDTWTIVSTVDEYSIVLDCGYHYEWIDFLVDLEDFDEDTTLYIPTENIFFFVEKRPIVYGDLIKIGKKVGKYDKFSVEDAKITISSEFLERPSQYYVYQRNAIMAKAFYWAEMYRYYFPNEMKILYEDDNFICYHLQQEPYYLNNLAINYGYNAPNE